MHFKQMHQIEVVSGIPLHLSDSKSVSVKRVKHAFIDWDYYPVKIMTGQCVGTAADVTRKFHNFQYIWQIIWLLLAPPLTKLISPRIR
jgi:hypothetical protein